MAPWAHPKITLLALALTGLVGCSQLQTPDYAGHADEARASVVGWQYRQAEASAAHQLTDLVQVADLQPLVDRALAHNPGLQQTALALQIAHAQRRVTGADRLPSVSTGFSVSRAEAQADSYATSLDISWELDLWQQLGDSLRAAELDVAASGATLQAASDSLAANVMRAWLDIILQRQLMAIESERLAILQSNETLITQRYRKGLGELTELDSARSDTAASRASLADYRETLARAERGLQQLLGFDGQTSSLPPANTFPQVLQPLTGLPEQDLARRPDLQRAYYDIQAAGYRHRVAYKSLLPSINLSAALSDAAASPADALLKSPAWSLLGQITAPLFQGGRLRAQADIARLSYEQQFWAYRETLLTAVTEVNDALGLELSLQQQQQHLQEALASAERSVDNYQAKYRQGLVNILDLLSVQQQTFDLQARLVQATYNRLINRIDLGLALGLGVNT